MTIFSPRRLVVLTVLLLAGWLGVRGLLAHHHLGAARADLTAAKQDLVQGRLDEGTARSTSSAGHARSAKSLTSDPLWRAATHVPWLGRTFDVAAAVARGVDEVTRTVLPPAVEAARTINPKTVRRPDGTIDLSLLSQATPALRRAADAAARADRDIQRLPTGGAAPIADARRRLATESRELASALSSSLRAVDLAPALLGETRPRQYFVLVQQDAESRGTGGLTGGFAVLRADRGRLTVTAQGSNADLSAQPVAVPAGVPKEYVDHYGPLSAFESWLGVNVSPNLPVVARVIAARWRAQSGQSVDGVITVDPEALSDILQGSPPIPLPNGTKLAARDVVPYLALYQYVGYPAPRVSDEANSNGPRKQLLAAISRAATARLVSGGGDSAALMRGVVHAVQSGHLKMASDDPELRGRLHEAGIDGALPEGPAPVAYPVVFNSAGGKLDYFLDRGVTYKASCAGSRRRSTITVELTNQAPATGLPPYVTTRFEAGGVVSSTDNRVTLVVYATRGSTLRAARLEDVSLIPYKEGSPFLAHFSEEGLPAWSVLLELPRGKPRTLVLELDEPAVSGVARVPVQPLARPLKVDVDVPRC